MDETKVNSLESSESAIDDVESANDTKVSDDKLAVDIATTQTECVEFIKGLLKHMSIACEVASTIVDNEIEININGQGAPLAIGHRGEVLDAIQYFTLVVANKAGDEFLRVVVDAGTYRKKRTETLTNLATQIAYKVSKTGKRLELEPMNPFERRIIHGTLADSKLAYTESAGEGKFRHVCVIPYNEVRGSDHKTYDNRRGGYGSKPQYGKPRYNDSSSGYAPKGEYKPRDGQTDRHYDNRSNSNPKYNSGDRPHHDRPQSDGKYNAGDRQYQPRPHSDGKYNAGDKKYQPRPQSDGRYNSGDRQRDYRPHSGAKYNPNYKPSGYKPAENRGEGKQGSNNSEQDDNT
ncbi:MAG: KH domain-containing protein [Christensenellaceae bacterium]|jgi:predicted RNA-binding protein Jag|nr:KH domain-containing protein [Christensenellaceae bacterium]